MKKLILFLVVVSLFACSKSDEASSAVHLDVTFDFLISNSENVDLLDPSSPNHFKEEDIKLFYEVDGERIEVYDPLMDNPRNFFLYKHENEYRIKVFLNDFNTSDKSITYIQWNDTDTDTVEALFNRTGNSVQVSKVWLNEIEIWDLTTDTDDNQYFTLIK